MNQDQPLIVIDVPNLCWRKFHTGLGKLKNGVILGFLEYIISLENKLQSTNFVFCFDHGISKRKEIYPEYKQNRIEKNELLRMDQIKELIEGQKQIELLRTEILHDIGFRNIFSAEGFEADDVIGSICIDVVCMEEQITELELGDYEERCLTLVSSDHDLYQLLDHTVNIWNPAKNEKVTWENFQVKWNVGCYQWSEVKAIAGCVSDNIVGIKGVGEKTACKYLRRELNEKSKAYQRIVEGKEIISRNQKLTKLPFKGTPRFKIKVDNCSIPRWKKVVKNLGLDSLIDKSPMTVRK